MKRIKGFFVVWWRVWVTTGETPSRHSLPTRLAVTTMVWRRLGYGRKDVS